MTGGDQSSAWKQAYRVLDVPASASPQAIKAAHRKLIKRWHPDRYVAGTREQADATRMTELINHAYSSVRAAPLLEHKVAERVPYSAEAVRRPAIFPWIKYKGTAQGGNIDWLGFCVRFVCGAIFGGLLS